MSSTARKAGPTQVAAVKPVCVVDESTIIADKAVLSGSHAVRLGADTIVQPYAKLNAAGGNITVGQRCTIAEATLLEVPEGHDGELTVGDDVCVESSVIISIASIGDGTEIGIGSKIEAGANIGKFCKIAPKQRVKAGEQLPDYTVLYGDHQLRLDSSLRDHESVMAARLKSQSLHNQALRQLIPNASSKWTNG